MKRLFRFLLLAGVVFPFVAGTATAQPKPLRHLNYTFDVSIATDKTMEDSGIGGGPVSGMSDYRGGTSDKGTISVDVLQAQPDSGLVMRISETARDTRNGVPTMCVVYGNGNVVCDQSNGSLNEEEMSLLRLLGRDFVNTALIDSKNHWQYSQSSPDASETNDYTIAGKHGSVMDLTFQRVLKVTGGGQPFTATTDGQISYNAELSVPLQVKEDTITRRSQGANSYTRTEQQITLTLASDSMQTASTH